MKNLNFIKLSSMLLITTSIYAQNIDNTIVSTKHNKNLTISNIANIQAGMGTIMIEFGHRFHIIYYAAKAKNWELAQYELEELIEAQEVAEITRPKYKQQLKEFEKNYLLKVKESIKNKDFDEFKKIFFKTVKSCNQCHKVTGHPYIQYKLPKEAPKYLYMNL